MGSSFFYSGLAPQQTRLKRRARKKEARKKLEYIAQHARKKTTSGERGGKCWICPIIPRDFGLRERVTGMQFIPRLISRGFRNVKRVAASDSESALFLGGATTTSKCFPSLFALCKDLIAPICLSSFSTHPQSRLWSIEKAFLIGRYKIFSSFISGFQNCALH